MTGASAAELPVAQQWFRFSTLDERTTLIEEPHAHELLSANAWHLRSRDRDLLIDCGLGITALTPMLRERFDREPVLVLTHAHLDHMGSAYEFTEVWAHPLEQAGNPAILAAAARPAGTRDSCRARTQLRPGPPASAHRQLPPSLNAAPSRLKGAASRSHQRR